MAKPKQTLPGPMNEHDRLLKVITRSERIRALRLKLEGAKEVVKGLKAQLEEEQTYREQEIFDEPEGELGFRDGELPDEVVKAGRTLRKLGATVTVGDGKSSGAGDQG